MYISKILLLLISWISLAPCYAYQYYYFSPEKVELSQASFNQYVLPQLRVINQEFYGLLRKSFPLQDEVIPLHSQISSMQEDWEINSKKCLEYSPQTSCQSMIRLLRQQAKSLEQMVVSFQRTKLNSSDVKNDKAVVDRILAISEFIDRVTMTNYQLLSKLESVNTITWTAKKIEQDKFEKKPIVNLLSTLNFYSQAVIIELIDKDFRSLYESLWVNFIKPIELQILPTANNRYLLHNLDSMNLGWSSFHHKMERGNLYVAPATLSVISTMRNRWNEVLRQYIRNKDFIPDNKIRPATLH